MICHTYIIVNSDMQKEEQFDGDLADFACIKLNVWITEHDPSCRIINIESSFWRDEIRPSQCNSSTWYKRSSMQLSVWYERYDGDKT